MRKRKGFTLVEVIVSVLIISLATAIFLPALINIFKYTARTEDNDISFTNAYNITHQEVVNDTETSSNTDVTCKVYENSSFTTAPLTLYNSSGVKQGEYTPNKIILYHSSYKIGRFGNSDKLLFNDYLIK